MSESSEDLIGVSEAARVLGITAETLREWADSRKVTTYRTAGGHRRFRRGDLIAFRDRKRTEAGAA